MYAISDKAVIQIRSNNKLIARLMIAFDRGQNTIENWLASKDVRLTTPIAVQVIMEETGLVRDQILEDTTSSDIKGNEFLPLKQSENYDSN